jgi:DNA-binding transcriptional MerR regulator
MMQERNTDPIGALDRTYYRIGEVSLITGLPASVLRFWESEFPSIRPKRTDSGQRLYRKGDIELILRIKHLLYEKKFTIQGAKEDLKKLSRPEAHEKNEATAIEEIRRGLLDLRNLLK